MAQTICNRHHFLLAGDIPRPLNSSCIYNCGLRRKRQYDSKLSPKRDESERTFFMGKNRSRKNEFKSISYNPLLILAEKNIIFLYFTPAVNPTQNISHSPSSQYFILKIYKSLLTILNSK